VAKREKKGRLKTMNRGQCPKLFAGIEEHCRFVEGRSKLSKNDVKENYGFNLV
jgi:hypothetical protein